MLILCERRLKLGKGRIYVVIDDVREPCVLRRFLGDHKLHSVSFCFPGRDESILYEDYLSSDLSQFDSDSSLRKCRFANIASEVRRATYALASELTERDGTLVLADRIQSPSEPDENAFAEFISPGFPDLATYWSLETSQFMVDESYKPGEAIGITPIIHFAQGEISPRAVYDVPIYRSVHRLRRNDRSYQRS